MRPAKVVFLVLAKNMAQNHFDEVFILLFFWLK